MIETWSEVTSLYNSLNHTSRGAKNLSVWGEIFASAYVLNRTQANIMWQDIIDLNVPKDITFAKYFVAQIFNKIVEHLPLRDAVEFLHMNPARLPLLYANPYNGCAFFDYCILGYHIIKNDMGTVVDFLNMRNKNNIEDKEIQNSENICNTFFEVVRKLESYSENSWHQQYPESSPKLAKSVYEWCDRAFPNSYMAQLARLHYLVLTKKTETDPVRIVKLLSLCEERNTSLFTDLLYMHRDIIPKKQIKELLKSIQLGGRLVKLGRSAFSDCESLATIEIPESVTEIGDHCFSGCTSLERIVIPEGVTHIGEYSL